jgi:hypothetical protein
VIIQPYKSRITGDGMQLCDQRVGFVGSALVSAIVLFLALNTNARACLVCYRPPYQSLLERVELSEQVVVARTIDETPFRWRGQIVRVIKGKDVEVDQFVVVKKPRAARVTLGDPQIVRKSALIASWTLEGSIDKELVGFLAGSVALSSRRSTSASARAQAETLRYFLPYLEHSNRQIADSAYTKIAGAPYEAIRLLDTAIKPKQLLAWIDDRQIPRKRKPLYITLLGVCGGKSESTILKQWIDEGWDRQDTDSLAALLTAHAELNGEETIRMIEESYIQNRDRQLGELIAAVTALRVHAQADGNVSRSRIQASFHLLLRERTPLAELIIEDFARWKDWSIAPKLMEIHAGAQQPWNNAMIIKYLKACPLPEARHYLLRHAKAAVPNPK